MLFRLAASSLVGLAVLGATLALSTRRLVRGEGLTSPSATSAVLAPVDGALVICGGGSMPAEVTQEFIRLAGGEQAKIVVITTASIDADSPDVEELLAPWRRSAVTSVRILHTRSREVANQDAFCEPLRHATGVWFAGGDQSRITAAYLGTQTERELHQVLRRGGVLGGTSAGAAIMSRVMIEGGLDRPQLGTGLGFLPGAIIDQHFLKRNRQRRLVNALRAAPDLVGLGIDESTALVIQGEDFQVLGHSAVCAFSLHTAEDLAPRTRMLLAGDVVNIGQLHRLLRPNAVMAAK